MAFDYNEVKAAYDRIKNAVLFVPETTSLNEKYVIEGAAATTVAAVFDYPESTSS